MIINVYPCYWYSGRGMLKWRDFVNIIDGQNVILTLGKNKFEQILFVFPLA